MYSNKIECKVYFLISCVSQYNVFLCYIIAVEKLLTVSFVSYVGSRANLDRLLLVLVLVYLYKIVPVEVFNSTFVRTYKHIYLQVSRERYSKI
jgi:hypothetical protein